MLWMFQRVFFTVPSDWARRWWPALRDMSRSEWLALAPLIVLVVALGVYPAPVLNAIAAPVERIIDAVRGAGLARSACRGERMLSDLVTLLPELILTALVLVVITVDLFLPRADKMLAHPAHRGRPRPGGAACLRGLERQRRRSTAASTSSTTCRSSSRSRRS